MLLPHPKQKRGTPVQEFRVRPWWSGIALSDGESKAHSHVVVGKADGSAWGGHVLEAYVWPTLELVISEAPGTLTRRIDPETGLALIDLAAHNDLGDHAT